MLPIIAESDLIFLTAQKYELLESEMLLTFRGFLPKPFKNLVGSLVQNLVAIIFVKGIPNPC